MARVRRHAWPAAVITLLAVIAILSAAGPDIELTATPGVDGSVSVNWQAIDDPSAASMRLSRNGALIAVISDLILTEFTDSQADLIDGMEYTYTLETLGRDGVVITSSSTVFAAIPSGDVTAPTLENVTAQETLEGQGGSIAISWGKSPGLDFLEYRLYRGEKDFDPETDGTLLAVLENDPANEQKITFINDGGDGAVSSPDAGGVTNEIVIKFSEGTTPIDIDEELSKHGMKFKKSEERDELLDDIAGLLEGDEELTPKLQAKLAKRAAAKQDGNVLKKGLRKKLGISHVELDDGTDLKAILKELRKNPDVEYAEPVGKVYAFSTTPDDPQYALQWHHETIRSEEAWDIATGTSDVVVAILDTGVQLDHPDLIANLCVNENELSDDGIDNDDNGYIDDVTGWNFVESNGNAVDDEGHGTLVAGIAAASGDNEEGVAGVAWGCRIMPVKVLDDEGAGVTTDIARGIIYAVDNGANIINISAGTPMYSQVITDAVGYAYDAGRLVVSAMGNNGDNVLVYPAALSKVLAVGSTDTGDIKASSSNYGDHISLTAPGVAIVTTGFNGYAASSGTSMAAPSVSGLGALLLSHHPELTPYQTIVMLRNSVVDLGETGWDKYYGYGRVDAFAALLAEVPIETQAVVGEPLTSPTSLFEQDAVPVEDLANRISYIDTGLEDGEYHYAVTASDVEGNIAEERVSAQIGEVTKSPDDSITIVAGPTLTLETDTDDNGICNIGDFIRVSITTTNTDGNDATSGQGVSVDLTKYGQGFTIVPLFTDLGGTNDVYQVDVEVLDAAGDGIDVGTSNAASQVTVSVTDDDEIAGGNDAPMLEISNSMAEAVDTIAPNIDENEIRILGTSNKGVYGDTLKYNPTDWVDVEVNLSTTIGDEAAVNPVVWSGTSATVVGTVTQDWVDDGATVPDTGGIADQKWSSRILVTAQSLDDPAYGFEVTITDDAGNEQTIQALVAGSDNTINIDNEPPALVETVISILGTSDMTQAGSATIYNPTDIIDIEVDISGLADRKSSGPVNFSGSSGTAAGVITQSFVDNGIGPDGTGGDFKFSSRITVAQLSLDNAAYGFTVTISDDAQNVQTLATVTNTINIDNQVPILAETVIAILGSSVATNAGSATSYNPTDVIDVEVDLSGLADAAGSPIAFSGTSATVVGTVTSVFADGGVAPDTGNGDGKWSAGVTVAAGTVENASYGFTVLVTDDADNTQSILAATNTIDVDNKPPVVVSAKTIDHNTVYVEFNEKIEYTGLNTAVTGGLFKLADDVTTYDSAAKDQYGTALTADIQTFYISVNTAADATQAWNTDATGVSFGSGTDEGGTSRTNKPAVVIDAGAITDANGNNIGATNFIGTTDGAGAVIIYAETRDDDTLYVQVSEELENSADDISASLNPADPKVFIADGVTAFENVTTTVTNSVAEGGTSTDDVDDLDEFFLHMTTASRAWNTDASTSAGKGTDETGVIRTNIPTLDFDKDALLDASGNSMRFGTYFATSDKAPPILLSADGQVATADIVLLWSEEVDNGASGDIEIADLLYTDASASGATTLSSMVDGVTNELQNDFEITVQLDAILDATDVNTDTIAAVAGSVFDEEGNAAGTAAVTISGVLIEVGLSAASSAGDESDATFTIPVTLSAISAFAGSVSYTVSASSTATGSGTDYTLADGTLTFAVGDTSEDISLVVVGDTLDEDDETVIITLSSPVGLKLSDTLPLQYTFTITDNDDPPTISFGAATSTSDETTTAVTIPVALSTASGRNITVDYEVTGGTATGGTDYAFAPGLVLAESDYILAPSTLTISAGSTSASISMTITDDSTYEGSETIELTISSPTNSSLGTGKVHTFVLTEEDTDVDGMADDWEETYLGSLIYSATDDVDEDGLTNGMELASGTDPSDKDSDNDGMPDGWEVEYGLSPLIDDSQLDPDGDLVKNIDEYKNGHDPTVGVDTLTADKGGSAGGCFLTTARR